MGVSDRPYFDWLRGALGRFEAATGQLAAIGGEGGRRDLWVLAGARTNPAVDFVRQALGSETTTVRFLDKYAREPGVAPADFNALDGVAGDACDVLMMSRASYMVSAPRDFLTHARRILRPGGLVVVDWVHGSADAPRLDLPGHHEYEGRRQPFLTTYCDPEALAEFPQEFGALIRHVNRPPAWANVDRPGAPVPLGERLGRLAGGGPRRTVRLGSYLDTLRAELGRAGKHLIEPPLMEEFFKVVFREARYLYPVVRKFHLYLLTVLRPVGK